MGENGDPTVNLNTRMVLRCIGTGPRGTTVTLSRILSVVEPRFPTSDDYSVVTNPAILVNGDLDRRQHQGARAPRATCMRTGTSLVTAGFEISGDLTATGTVTRRYHPRRQIDSRQHAAYHRSGDQGVGLPEPGRLDSDQHRSPSQRQRTFCGTGRSIRALAGWTFDTPERQRGERRETCRRFDLLRGRKRRDARHGQVSGFTQISVIIGRLYQDHRQRQVQARKRRRIQFVTNGDFDTGWHCGRG